MGRVRAVVTGATGYVGTRLVGSLLREGWELMAVVQPADPAQLPPAVLRVEDTGSSLANAALLAEFHPDVVLHLAACQFQHDSPDAADALMEANVSFGARMLAAAAQAGARGVVAAGSFQTHGRGTADYAPQTLYAATKQAFSDIAAHYNRWTPLRVVVLELSDTYGPEDPRPKFLNLLADAARTGQPLDATPGEQVLHPLHVDDVVGAFTAAAGLLCAGADLGSEYSVSGPRGVTLRELADAFREATGLDPDVRFGAREYRPNEIMNPYLGPTLPGWSPSIQLEDGLRAVYGAKTRSGLPS